MSFTNSNDYITGRKPVLQPGDGAVYAQRFTLTMTAADAALNTIGQIGILPPLCVPVDVSVDMTDPDASTAAMILQVGIWDGVSANLSSAAADGGGVWGTTTAVTADSSQRITRNGVCMDSVAPVNSDRKIGIKVQTPPTTAQAFTLGLTIMYRTT